MSRDQTAQRAAESLLGCVRRWSATTNLRVALVLAAVAFGAVYAQPCAAQIPLPDFAKHAQYDSMHAALEKRKIAHEWLYRHSEGHGFYDPDNVRDMYEKILIFLDRNIGPGANLASAR
jgi:hypothetical protein